MSEEVKAAAPAAEPKIPLSPFEYIAQKYPKAPNEAIIQGYKAQVPGGRVRFFELPDGKRATLLRAINPLELAAIQVEAAKHEASKQMFELQLAVATKCTLWSSFTQSGKLTEPELRAAGAFLAATLQTVIWDLSDYIDPAVMDNLIIDL